MSEPDAPETYDPITGSIIIIMLIGLVGEFAKKIKIFITEVNYGI